MYTATSGCWTVHEHIQGYLFMINKIDHMVATIEHSLKYTHVQEQHSLLTTVQVLTTCMYYCTVQYYSTTVLQYYRTGTCSTHYEYVLTTLLTDHYSLLTTHYNYSLQVYSRLYVQLDWTTVSRKAINSHLVIFE